ncbi:hypothetical protein [Cellulomonas sp. HZM]|uniref:hypothetical protein n=1 Tax=Cellulomonas sp. HZM TaxID=1454010 RepID=UPI0004933C6A|nr:hypothetical protein [Cellulomonas sp. HZM]
MTLALAILASTGAISPTVADDTTTDRLTWAVTVPDGLDSIDARVTDSDGTQWGYPTVRTLDGVATFTLDWPRVGPHGDPVVQVLVSTDDYVGGYVGDGALVGPRERAVPVHAPADLGTFSLRAAGTITVRTPAGSDPAQVGVSAIGPDGNSGFSYPMADDGTYRVRRLDPELTYRLQVTTGPASTVVGGWVTSDGRTSDLATDAGAFTAGSDVDVVPDPAATISGTLRHADRPLSAGVRWTVLTTASYGGRVSSSTVASDGTWSVGGLRAGARYTVCFRGWESSDNGCVGEVGARVTTLGTELAAPASGVDAVVWQSINIAGSHPAMVGDLVVDGVLSVAAPTWDTPEATTSYTWYSDGRVAHGTVTSDASGSSYRVAPDDVGHIVWVTATATAPEHLDGSYTPASWWTVSAGASPSGLVDISGEPRVGSRITAAPSGWDAGTALTYTWSIDGRTVGTGATFTPTPAQLGKLVELKATGTRPGHDVGGATAAFGVLEGKAPRALVAPRFVGTARSGSTITVSPGTWDSPDVRFAYSWKSGNVTSSDNHSAKKLIDLSDVGRKIHAHVVVSRPGYASTSFDLTSVTIPKVRPTVTAKLADRTVRTSSRAKVVVKVTGRIWSSGTVKVRYGSHSVTAKMTSASKNKVTVTLPRLKHGTYKVSASFTPSGTTAKVLTSGNSATTKLAVR